MLSLHVGPDGGLHHTMPMLLIGAFVVLILFVAARKVREKARR